MSVHAHADQQNSLPLMGIGNPVSSSVVHFFLHYSLPLMGIGNSGLVGNPMALRRLITPHGDWERPAECRIAGVACDSLPLMGIGNDTLKDESWDGLVLITPHGDWELPSGLASVLGIAELITPHGDWELPSGLASVLGIAELITPHGDWEPRPARGWKCGFPLITPHGDWERTRHRGPGAPTQDSLPLMGIGNLHPAAGTADRFGSHYPSWGLGTPRSR